jgi:hypothetical protein
MSKIGVYLIPLGSDSERPGAARAIVASSSHRAPDVMR